MIDPKVTPIRGPKPTKPATVTGINDMPRKMAEAYFVDAATFLADESVEIDWLIPGMIPRGNVVLLSGEPGGGKSFLAYDLLRATVTGTSWLGRGPVSPDGPLTAMILNYDNPTETLRTRLKKIGLTKDMPFTVHTLGYTKPTIANAPAILTIPTEAGRLKYALDHLKPALIIFDSFRQGQTLDENSSKDMMVIMQILKSWTSINRTTVLVLHHTTKGGGDKQKWAAGARGSGEIIGSSDVVIDVEPNKIEWTKHRTWKMGAVKSATFEIKDAFSDEESDDTFSGNQTKVVRLIERINVRATSSLPGELEAIAVDKIVEFVKSKGPSRVVTNKDITANVQLKAEQIKDGLRIARQQGALEFTKTAKGLRGYRIPETPSATAPEA